MLKIYTNSVIKNSPGPFTFARYNCDIVIPVNGYVAKQPFGTKKL